MAGWSLRQQKVGKDAFPSPGLLLVLILAALLVRSDRLNTLHTEISADSATPIPVEPGSAEVRRGDIKKALMIEGELRAVRSRTIFTSTNEEAKITYLPPEGSVVKAGDRLVELDSTTIVNNIKDAEEKIVAAENEIIQAGSAHESALRDMEVELSRLWLVYEQAKVKARPPAELMPKRDYQENQFALEKAKTEYDNQIAKMEHKKREHTAELQVKTIERDKLKVQLDQARSNLAGVNIAAPSEGMVIYSDHWMERRKVQIGDVVWGGFPIVRLPDLSEMEVMAQVNEVDGPRLSIGQKATIRLDSYPDIEITGSVIEIAQTAVKAGWRDKAKVFRVVISLDETVTEIMKPGMSAQASIIVEEHTSQLLVPRSAVNFQEDATTVMRVEGESKRPVSITILAAGPEFYAVADNGALKEGDRVLSRWQQ